MEFTEGDLRKLREDASDRRGLYQKFVAFKCEDGKIVGDPLTDVFVLRPDRDVHAREALRAYARSAGHEEPTRNLARDLGAWLARLDAPTKE